jgi:hypothetical protein
MGQIEQTGLRPQGFLDLFAPTKRLLRPYSFGFVLDLAKRAPNRRHETREPRFQNVVSRPNLEGVDGDVFTKSAGNKDERQIRSGVSREMQSGEAVERWKRIVRQDEVKLALLKSHREFRSGLDARYFASKMIGLEQRLSEPRILGVILRRRGAPHERTDIRSRENRARPARKLNAGRPSGTAG